MNARAQFPPIPDDRFPPADQDVAQLRVPPQAIDAERSVLGALLIDNSAWDRVGDLLQEGDFYRYEHRLVYGAIAALCNATKPADTVTVYEHLERLGKAGEVGGLAYLSDLANVVPSASAARRYAEIVREKAILRRLVSTGDEIASKAFNTQGRSIEAIVDEAQAAILAVAESGARSADDWQDAEAGVVQVLDRIQEAADGNSAPDFTPTGLKDLDERLDGGMRAGELIVVGARPSMGKSALGLTVAVNVAGSGAPVGMFSMEMPKSQVYNRAMALRGRIHLSRIKRPERLRDADWPSITEAVEGLRKLPLSVNDQSGLNINQVRSKARALKRRHGKLGLLIVDYLGLMPGLDPKMNRAYQIAEITQGLKNLAKELRCPVMLLVQVSRKAEERTDQMPILSDLRDSGDIEQDADIVVFIHRPYKVAPTLGDEWKEYAKASVAKVRDGDPGYLDLKYVGENLHFMDWPTDQEVPSSKVRVAKTSRGASL